MNSTFLSMWGKKTEQPTGHKTILFKENYQVYKTGDVFHETLSGFTEMHLNTFCAKFQTFRWQQQHDKEHENIKNVKKNFTNCV